MMIHHAATEVRGQAKGTLNIYTLISIMDLVCLITFIIEHCYDIAIRKGKCESPIKVPSYGVHRGTD